MTEQEFIHAVQVFELEQRMLRGRIENLVVERNAVLEQVAAEFDKMKVFGDTATSFAAFVRGMKL